jgi:hypothetical protein
MLALWNHCANWQEMAHVSSWPPDVQADQSGEGRKAQGLHNQYGWLSRFTYHRNHSKSPRRWRRIPKGVPPAPGSESISGLPTVVPIAGEEPLSRSPVDRSRTMRAQSGMAELLRSMKGFSQWPNAQKACRKAKTDTNVNRFPPPRPQASRVIRYTWPRE